MFFGGAVGEEELAGLEVSQGVGTGVRSLENKQPRVIESPTEHRSPNSLARLVPSLGFNVVIATATARGVESVHARYGRLGQCTTTSWVPKISLWLEHFRESHQIAVNGTRHKHANLRFVTWENISPISGNQTV